MIPFLVEQTEALNTPVIADIAGIAFHAGYDPSTLIHKDYRSVKLIFSLSK